MRLDATPFLLIDLPGGRARLYRAPVATIVAVSPDQVADALVAMRDAVAAGHDVAGFLSYEAGAALAPRPLAPREGTTLPLAWFGVFAGSETIDEVAALLPDPAGAWIGAAVPGIGRAAYDAAFAEVKANIAAGDIYQANLTFRAVARIAGDPIALYAGLRATARAGHGALVWTGADWLVSLSPELFFTLDGDRLSARPMKGTARRGETADEDRTLARTLATDEKQRAENLMIVDLIRNDLSRVAVPGSVAVPELFTVETYPTVHQMTSQVTAMLDPEHDAIDVLAAAFPCGSVTGAPKQRAMEVIAAVEPDARGAYTGSIGWIAANGDAAFNVAIRTLHIAGDSETATLGLGSGVIADSTVDEEWSECLAKGAFLTHRRRWFDLIETMAFDPEDGILLLEPHLERMKASAETFGFAFDRHHARNELQAATFRLRAKARVRLLLAPSGALAIEVAPAPEPATVPWRVAVVKLPVDPRDFRLRHKTSDRAFYDAARIAAGADEVVFERPDGFLTEGSFTSLFVARDGRLLTPPLAHGLLPGVLRGDLIATGRAIEAPLMRADLSGGFFVGNAVRGLIPAIVAVAKSSVRPL